MLYRVRVSDGSLANIVDGAGGVFRYPPPYFVDEYISRDVPDLDAHLFAMMTADQTSLIEEDR